MSSQKKNKSNQKKQILQNLFILIFIILIFFLISKILNIADISTSINKFGIFAPLLYIILKASTIVIAPIAGAPLYPISGIIFGFWKGLLFTIIGETIGVSIAFFLGRRYGKKVLKIFFPNETIRKSDEMLHYIGNWKGLLYSKLIFFALHDIISYAAGLTKIKYITFILINFISTIIPIVLLVGFGSIFISENSFNLILIIGILLGLFGILLEIFRNKLNKNL